MKDEKPVSGELGFSDLDSHHQALVEKILRKGRGGAIILVAMH